MSRASRLKAKKRRQYKRMVARRAVKRLLRNRQVMEWWDINYPVGQAISSIAGGKNMLFTLKNICEEEGWNVNEGIIQKI